MSRDRAALGALRGLIRGPTAAPSERTEGQAETGAPGYKELAATVQRLEEELRASTERIRLLLDSTLDAVVTMDDRGRITGWNRIAEESFGWPAGEVLGRTVAETIIPPRYRQAHRRGLERFLATGKGRYMGTRFETEALDRDGREFAVELTVSPLPAGESVGFTAFIRDISQRKRAEEALRESEDRYRSFVETTREWVWAIDREGRHIYSNPAIEAILGYAPEELIGRDSLELIHQEDREQVQRLLPAWIAERRGWSDLVLRWRHKDGSYRWLESNAVPILDGAGEVVGFRGVDRDITERTLVERALRESEERFRTLVERLPAIVYSADFGPSGQWFFVSSQIERLLGFTPAEWLADPDIWYRQIHPDDRRRVIEDEHRTTSSGAPLVSEYRMFSKDGRVVWFRDEATLVTDEAGSPRHLEGVMYDITARRRAEQDLRETIGKLRRADEERRLLLARLVQAQEEERQRIAEDIHDDSIQVMAALGVRLAMLRRKLEATPHAETVEHLEETVELTVARLRHLLFELRPVALDRDGLAAALKMYLEEARKETGLAFDLVDRLVGEPPVETRTILYRIAQEALVNVRKHAKAERVDVALDDWNGGIRVRIQDDGQGFVLSEAERSRPGHLGLTAMRERAEMAGGWFSVRTAPNRGTTVELWLPAHAGRRVRQEA